MVTCFPTPRNLDWLFRLQLEPLNLRMPYIPNPKGLNKPVHHFIERFAHHFVMAMVHISYRNPKLNLLCLVNSIFDLLGKASIEFSGSLIWSRKYILLVVKPVNLLSGRRGYGNPNSKNDWGLKCLPKIKTIHYSTYYSVFGLLWLVVLFSMNLLLNLLWIKTGKQRWFKLCYN